MSMGNPNALIAMTLTYQRIRSFSIKLSIVGWIKRKRIHRLWKCCYWIRRKNTRLNRSTERSRRSPPF